MKIVCLSDNHGFDIRPLILEECDILLIGGDCEPVNGSHSYNFQKQWWFDTFIPDLKEIPAKHICVIGGNHSTFLSEIFKSNNENILRNELPSHIHYLRDSFVIINGIKIWGTPWVNCPPWGNGGPPVWNFSSKEYDMLRDYAAQIPDDVDIILSHGPAFGYCDTIRDDRILDFKEQKYGDKQSAEHLGNRALTKRIEEIKNKEDCKLKYVFSGHIHSANHEYEVILNDFDSKPIKLACTSILDEDYSLGTYKPLELEYDTSSKSILGETNS